MGRRVAGQGQSKYTRRKEEFFGMCLGWHISQEANKTEQRPYLHFDLTAGEGRNPQQNVKGTPELFLTQIKKFKALPFNAWFVEKNRERAQILQQRIGHSAAAQQDLPLGGFSVGRCCHVLTMDNLRFMRDYMPEMVCGSSSGKLARGSIISDPNGYSVKQGGLDLALTREILHYFSRCILLVSFRYGAAKRVRGYVNKGECGPIKNVETRTVADFLPLCRQWLISEPAGQWVYLCGSTHWMPEDRRRGTFVNLQTHRGKEILRQCDDIGVRQEDK